MAEIKQHYFADQEQWVQQIIAQYAEQQHHAGLLIVDIDDTLLDSKGRWYEHYELLAKKHGPAGPVLVTVEEFKAAGQREYFEPFVDDYPTLKQRLMLNPHFNAGMSLVTASTALQQAGQDHGVPHGYLSTRAAVLGDITHQNLQEHGFADTPILLRAEHIAYDTTIAYKLGSLATLRTVLDSNNFQDSMLYYVDDYAQLIDEINEAHSNIVGIPFEENTSWSTIVQQCLGLSIED